MKIDYDGKFLESRLFYGNKFPKNVSEEYSNAKKIEIGNKKYSYKGSYTNKKDIEKIRKVYSKSKIGFRVTKGKYKGKLVYRMWSRVHVGFKMTRNQDYDNYISPTYDFKDFKITRGQTRRYGNMNLVHARIINKKELHNIFEDWVRPSQLRSAKELNDLIRWDVNDKWKKFLTKEQQNSGKHWGKFLTQKQRESV